MIRLRAELEAKKAHINELNSYIEQLLVKVMDTTPRLLQAGQLAHAIKWLLANQLLAVGL